VKEKDEDRFFGVFNTVTGGEFLDSKCIGKPVDGTFIYIPADYKSLELSSGIKAMFAQITEVLGSDGNFGAGNLNHHIDALLIDHPLMGSRVVEFDEEVNFTPPRKFTLQILRDYSDYSFISPYLLICNDLRYLNGYVIPKYQIKAGIHTYPATIRTLIEWLDEHVTSSVAHVEAKPGFNYLGGRMSQRAYYDTILDVAHLARQNDHLSPPLRFAKRTFEELFHKSFGNMTNDEIAEGIRRLLNSYYDFTLPPV
jgi:hypothetical protein